jgi:hypothetical protein
MVGRIAAGAQLLLAAAKQPPKLQPFPKSCAEGRLELSVRPE